MLHHLWMSFIFSSLSLSLSLSLSPSLSLSLCVCVCVCRWSGEDGGSSCERQSKVSGNHCWLSPLTGLWPPRQQGTCTCTCTCMYIYTCTYMYIHVYTLYTLHTMCIVHLHANVYSYTICTCTVLCTVQCTVQYTCTCMYCTMYCKCRHARTNVCTRFHTSPSSACCCSLAVSADNPGQRWPCQSGTDHETVLVWETAVDVQSSSQGSLCLPQQQARDCAGTHTHMYTHHTCTCACICIVYYIHIHLMYSTCTQTHIHIHTLAHARTHTCTHTRTHTHMHKDTVIFLTPRLEVCRHCLVTLVTAPLDWCTTYFTHYATSQTWLQNRWTYTHTTHAHM